jgi:hypothetical protein
MNHGFYTGPRADLKNGGALLRPHYRRNYWLAQFDHYVFQERAGERAPVPTESHGWHLFPKKHFTAARRLGGPMSRSHERKVYREMPAVEVEVVDTMPQMAEDYAPHGKGCGCMHCHGWAILRRMRKE